MPRTSPSPARNARRALAARAAIVTALGILAATVAGAQPFGAWLTLSGNAHHGYVQVPHSPALNPTGAFTLEAWVAIAGGSPGDCRSITGKNYTQAWWVGACVDSGQRVLRSYLKGGGSPRNGGVVPSNVWTHVAVVFTGSRRRHYVNGEMVFDVAEAGPLTSSTDPLRIGSDVAWQFSPQGAIDEVRLWNVARTTAQIRASLGLRIAAPQPGLVAVWALDGNPGDVVGPYDGALGGTGAGFLTAPVALSCGASTPTSLCLQDRFVVRVFWRTNPAPGTPTDGQAHTVPVANPGSGLFWFFSANNWEVMVKALDGCALNARYWIFSAATTNVFYRLEVHDVRSGAAKVYFNYPGPPAPAVTDTGAFATCP